MCLIPFKKAATERMELTDDPDDERISGEGGQREDGVHDGQEDDGRHGVLPEVHLGAFHAHCNRK